MPTITSTTYQSLSLEDRAKYKEVWEFKYPNEDWQAIDEFAYGVHEGYYDFANQPFDEGVETRQVYELINP
jgi:hypothetical protein